MGPVVMNHMINISSCADFKTVLYSCFHAIQIAALLIDAIGALSFTVPFIGEFADVIWAPMSSFLIFWLFNRSIMMASLGTPAYFNWHSCHTR